MGRHVGYYGLPASLPQPFQHTHLKSLGYALTCFLADLLFSANIIFESLLLGKLVKMMATISGRTRLPVSVELA